MDLRRIAHVVWQVCLGLAVAGATVVGLGGCGTKGMVADLLSLYLRNGSST
jgi:hypothetical protein